VGKKRTEEALKILQLLGLPRQQLNERSALCLLALLNLRKNIKWINAESPLIGITPIMDWVFQEYGKKYAPNSRETFRRQTMHQFVEAGIALYNPDSPERAVNSPHAVYQITPELLAVLKQFGSKAFANEFPKWLKKKATLVAKYAKEREMLLIPVILADGQSLKLSSGKHSALIKSIIEEFAPRFVPGGKLVYVGDTGTKWGYFDTELLSSLGVKTETHGKMPDAVIFYPDKNWLLLIEAVTSHGPVDGKRHDELSRLFKSSKAGLVFVSAFPDRKTMNKYLDVISWETEVWVADSPTHLIHFNGVRFLGPY
jgi:BsuBI/PstI restriction endonuclease domain/BsuBI/PstI restriction endonuclease HTH domain